MNDPKDKPSERSAGAAHRPCCGHESEDGLSPHCWACDASERSAGAAPIDVSDVETIRKALAIGSVSWDGDDWYAAEAGYDYDAAEATLLAAQAIVVRLASVAAEYARLLAATSSPSAAHVWIGDHSVATSGNTAPSPSVETTDGEAE